MAVGDLIQFQVMDSSALPGGGNIDGNGVIARLRFQGLAPGAAFNASKGSMLLQRPGWSTSRVYSVTNVTDAITFEALHRETNPNETVPIQIAVGGDVDIYVSLSDVVWISDTILSVTLLAGFYGLNTAMTLAASLTQSSTRPYPRAVMSYLGLEPYPIVPATGLLVEVMADHWEARNLRPVAAVDLYAKSGAAENVTQCADLALSTQVTQPNKVPCYAGIVTQGALPNGPGTIGVRAYPWVGTAIWDSANIGDAWPTQNLPIGHPCELDGDGSYSPAYAVVSPTGALIGAPFVTKVEPGAYVSGDAAYANLNTAAAAIIAFNNTGAARARVHADAAGGVILVPSGTTLTGVGTSMTALALGNSMLRVRTETGGDRNTTIFTTGGASKTIYKRMIVQNMRITPGAVGTTHTVFDGAAAGGAPGSAIAEAAYVYFTVRDCVGTGNGDTANAPFYRTGWKFLFNNNFTNFGDDYLSTPESQVVATCAIHGGTYDNAAVAASSNCRSIAGVRFINGGVISQNAGVQSTNKGMMIHASRFDTLGTGGIGAGVARGIGAEGMSIVNVIVRQTRVAGAAGIIDGGESPTLTISADYIPGTGEKPAVQNVLLAYLTLTGGRVNMLYNEVGASLFPPVRIEKCGRRA